ncbi:MAG: hypothetical protein QOI92_1981, partial [Chloroflexota bacterium]|nr:hypothetical protein [Chloroflexota bacterium]
LDVLGHVLVSFHVAWIPTTLPQLRPVRHDESTSRFTELVTDLPAPRR